jgi:CDGSH-type Zn-finger protein/truncated hemoglobin YjbI/ferredoxin
MTGTTAELLRAAQALIARAGQAGDDPLLANELWALALTATRSWAASPATPTLGRVTAVLQKLALDLADPVLKAERLAELAAAQAQIPAQIRAVPGGPLLVVNVDILHDHLGVPIPGRPLTALCRCGESADKPICDNACERTGFITVKDPHRIADRRDVYLGQSVTVLDNRGICQHSGFCTDRLPTVFHAGDEPFVTASGGRMDEIIRAVRDCPSGALSYALDGVEARDQVDHSGRRSPAIEVSQDGPYRVTGGIELVDQDSHAEPANRGASREHYALCRCGHSQNKPFCSGMHWYVGFHDPVRDSTRVPSLFEWCGGRPALTRMTRLFYEKYVPADPVLGPVFATMSVDHPQRVAAWLAEVFGGPTGYSDDYGGYSHMISQHVGKCIKEEWRARWVELMIQSSYEAGLPNDPEFRSAFSSYLEWGSRLAVENSQTTSRPPLHMPMPSWGWSTAAGPPGSRVSALDPPDAVAGAGAEPADPVPVIPDPGVPLWFGEHIRPLFRARDRKSMLFAFDLWSEDDVRTHAVAILARLQAGTMPCDGPWPADWIELFARWIADGTPS